MDENKRPDGCVLSIRLLPEEAEILKAKAKEANMSQACFLKNVIVHGGAYKNTNFTNTDRQSLQYEINRIGNNLNQIAYHVRSYETIDEIEFLRIHDHYVDLLSALYKFINDRD